MGMDVVQIEPIRLRIDLQAACQIVRGRNNAIHVDVIGLAFADQSAGRMTENGDVAVFQRAHHAIGLRLARKVEK